MCRTAFCRATAEVGHIFCLQTGQHCQQWLAALPSLEAASGRQTPRPVACSCMHLENGNAQQKIDRERSA
eukprot:352386-Chlamydomonas_euryale.AAC.7